MRTLKTLLLVVAITFSSVVSANTETTPKETKAITKEISKLLKSPKIDLTKEVLVYVKITMNDQNEMVVLSTDSKNKEVIRYIKKRLNYNKLSVKLKEEDKTFIVPVRIMPDN